MIRVFLTLLLALFLLTIESVIVRYAGFSVTRIDVTVVLLVWLALRAPTLEGAAASFGVGYLLDLMSGRPTGLYTFLAVLTFLVGRVASGVVDVRSPAMLALFSVAASAGHGLLATLLSWMVTRENSAAPLYALPMQVLLTGIAAILLNPLLKKLEWSDQRTKPSLLR